MECHLTRLMPEGNEAEPEVWVTQVDGRWELHDTVVHDRPAHPEELIRWLVEQPLAQQA